MFRTANQKRKSRTGFGLLKLGLMVVFALVPANSSLALDMTLAWDPSSSDVDGYRAFYREAGHSYDYSQPAWEGWETACTIYGLDDETTYYFVVRAYNELGESGNNLDTAIGNLVKQGLPTRIQKALDGVRVIGNNAVHPGQIDVEDNPEIALSLFTLVNLIVENMITRMKKVDELYTLLPDAMKEHIEKRDTRD